MSRKLMSSKSDSQKKDSDRQDFYKKSNDVASSLSMQQRASTMGSLSSCSFDIPNDYHHVNDGANKKAVYQASLCVDASLAGQRLDVAIAALVPDMGIRGRRRLWEYTSIRVNGKARAAGYRVSLGDIVSIDELLSVERDSLTHSATESIAPPEGLLPFTVSRYESGLCAVYKPSGLHSAIIAGSPATSVEALLTGLCSETKGYSPRLCNRLDAPTSGLVVASCSTEGETLWAEAEAHGRIGKRYLALVEGVCDKPATIRNHLDTANRRITKVCAIDSPNPLRHTTVTPLATWSLDVAPQKAALATVSARAASEGMHLLSRDQFVSYAAYRMLARAFDVESLSSEQSFMARWKSLQANSFFAWLGLLPHPLVLFLQKNLYERVMCPNEEQGVCSEGKGCISSGVLVPSAQLLSAEDVLCFLQYAWRALLQQKHHTEWQEAINVLQCYPNTSSITLVQCDIHKGARHQIRAHLASRGYPIIGDALYGGGVPSAMLFLHHGRMCIADSTTYYMPAWLGLLPKEAQHAALRALTQ